MTTSLCKRLTIFEGPDGSGKSTLARQYAQATGAHYVHFPALTHVNKGLARLYVEAMLPALLGYQDVVFDRCWLSEVPYGTVYRHGTDRLGDATRLMLERLAMRCATLVVLCQPPVETCLANFRSRKGEEYLDNELQLAKVYKAYTQITTQLPMATYAYTLTPDGLACLIAWDFARSLPHRTAVRTAGNFEARILVVGEQFAAHKEHDPWYQWPFASFSNLGCSHWLTQLLSDNKIDENDLLWINADELFKAPDLLHMVNHVVALGTMAHEIIDSHGIEHITVPHPQQHKRFKSGTEYPLITLLKGLTS